MPRYAARLTAARFDETMASLRDAGIEVSPFPGGGAQELLVELEAATGVHASAEILGSAVWIDPEDFVVAPRCVAP
jgi:hypothetical protein